jgi:hypothetical protein
MKRTLTAIAAALAALLFVVAAPALSSRPYQPAAVDFEMAAPAAGLHAAGSAVTSAPLRAPKRFNIVGLRWSGRAEPHVRVRARAADGAWSPWRALGVESDHNPDPRSGERSVTGVTDAAWAGDADYVQYRLSRRVPGLRLHFVNTLGTATAADRAKTAIRRAANRGVIAAATLLGGQLATAASPQPAIVPRSGWNAKDCPPRAAAQYGQVKAAFVHHTVTLNDYSAEESPAIVLGICRYHRNSNGWNDVGYNFLVDKYGTIFEGRAGGVGRPVVGAQAEGFNSQSTGIANLGDFSTEPQSAAALQAMAKLIRWKLPLEGVPTSGRVRLTSAGGSTNRYAAGTSALFERISGHRDGNNTACPGDALYAQLPELRRLTGDVQPDGTAAPAPAPTASTRLRLATPAVVEVPAAAVVTGELQTAGGQPVAGMPVAIQALRGGSWRPVAQVTTDGGGAFRASVPTSASAVLRAVFPGATAYRRSTSNRASVRVRPDLTLKPPAARLPAGGRVRLRGGINPSKPRVGVVLERRAGKRYRRVSSARVAAARGRFGLTVRPRQRGLYRAYARFAGDSANVRGRSPYAYFRIVRSGAGGVSAPKP